VSDFPVVLTNAVDGSPPTGTEILAKHLNNLETKVGIDASAVVTSLDYLIKNAASIDPGHKHSKLWASDGSPEAVTVDAAGNVGIGTTSPGTQLHIYKSIADTTSYSSFKMETLRNAVSYNFTLAPYAADYSDATEYQNKTVLQTYGSGIALSAVGDSDNIDFYAGNRTGSRMRITSTGNVGIGTTSPGTQLHIYKSIADTTSYSSFKMETLRNAVSYNFTLAPYAADYSDATEYQNKTVLQTYGSGIALSAVGDSDNIDFYAGNRTGSRMRITSTGNVGIGTTTPDAAAILHLDSTTKGFLPPGMTTHQRTAITSPPDGLIVYDLTLDLMFMHLRRGWVSMLY
jgi:predicted small secreted protein